MLFSFKTDSISIQFFSFHNFLTAKTIPLELTKESISGAVKSQTANSLTVFSNAPSSIVCILLGAGPDACPPGCSRRCRTCRTSPRAAAPTRRPRWAGTPPQLQQMQMALRRQQRLPAPPARPAPVLPEDVQGLAKAHRPLLCPLRLRALQDRRNLCGGDRQRDAEWLSWRHGAAGEHAYHAAMQTSRGLVRWSPRRARAASRPLFAKSLRYAAAQSLSLGSAIFLSLGRPSPLRLSVWSSPSPSPLA